MIVKIANENVKKIQTKPFKEKNISKKAFYSFTIYPYLHAYRENVLNMF